MLQSTAMSSMDNRRFHPNPHSDRTSHARVPRPSQCLFLRVRRGLSILATRSRRVTLRPSQSARLLGSAWHRNWTMKLHRPTPLALTLHSVFGPKGPFLHSGLSVLPHVTHTCIPSPSPALFGIAMEFFLARFFSLTAFPEGSRSLGGRPGFFFVALPDTPLPATWDEAEELTSESDSSDSSESDRSGAYGCANRKGVVSSKSARARRVNQKYHRRTVRVTHRHHRRRGPAAVHAVLLAIARSPVSAPETHRVWTGTSVLPHAFDPPMQRTIVDSPSRRQTRRLSCPSPTPPCL